MPLFLQQTSPLLGVWKIEESEEELLALLDNPDAYRPTLARWQSTARRREWLASRVLLKTVAGEELTVAYRETGAPYLVGSPWHVSFSHTKGYAAVVLQNGPATGIDIEYRSERVHKIRRRFLTAAEEFIAPVAGTENVSRLETDYLLIGWCAKETLFKMIGQEKVDFLHHLHLCPFIPGASGYLDVSETRTPHQASFRLGYRVFPDFILTWSTEE